MASLLNGQSNPATTITTTTETQAAFIPATQVVLPANSPPNIVVRGCVWVTTGTATTSVSVRLRVGNGTSGTLIGNSIVIPVIASTSNGLLYHFVDTNGPADLSQSGYSVCVLQNSASGNGTINAVTYEVDYSVA